MPSGETARQASKGPLAIQDPLESKDEWPYPYPPASKDPLAITDPLAFKGPVAILGPTGEQGLSGDTVTGQELPSW